MSNFIVTGAAGFIGSALAAELIQNGHTVVTIDNLSTGYETNIPDGVEFILGDCGDNETIKKIPKRNSMQSFILQAKVQAKLVLIIQYMI